MNDYDRMQIRADTLFCYNSRGRMIRCNDPDRQPAPHLFLGRTVEGHILRFEQSLSDDCVRRLTEIMDCQPAAITLEIPAGVSTALLQVLERVAPVTRKSGGPVYRFPDSIEPSGDALEITPANVERVRETVPWLYDSLADWQPCFAALRDGAAVSVCFSSRRGDAAHEAGVETLPTFRRQGCARAVTAAWAASVRAAGRMPLYSTWNANTASQALAHRLQLIQFGTDLTLGFSSSSYPGE